jgi:type IV pilus assembly protein PilM
LPPVPEYKLTQIVRYEIQQQIPFALDQIALDYQILNRTDVGAYDVMMAAIKVDVVDKHIDVLREARCSINAVDVCPIAAYNWLKHVGEFGTQGECVALLDLGASTTDIVIERGNQFRFTRPLNLAGNDITGAIRDAFGVSFADAEKLKRQRGFAPTGNPERDGKIGEVIGGVLSRLLTEITRSFAYFRSLPGGGTIDRVIVTGGGACLRGIVPYLQRQFGVEVRIAQPIAGLAIAPAAQQVNEHPEQSSVVLGMALRGLQEASIEINLIPPEILASVRRHEQLLYWVLTFVTLGFIAASIIPARETKNRMIQNQIETLRQYIRLYDPVVAENPLMKSEFVGQFEEADNLVKARQVQLDKLAEAYENCGYYILDDLKLLNDLRPEGGKIWFSSIETSVIMPGGLEQQARRGVPGPSLGGFGLRGNPAGRFGGQAQSAVISTGFPSIYPATRTQDRFLGGPRGLGRQQGLNQGPNQGPNLQQVSAVPAKPNGYRIYGYAKDSDCLMLFLKQLKDAPRFKEGVYWNDALFEQVYMTAMDNAEVPQRGAGPGPQGGMGVSGPRVGAEQMAYSGQMWDTVIFFQVDAQFAPSPGPAPGTVAGPGPRFPGMPGPPGLAPAPLGPGAPAVPPGAPRSRRESRRAARGR